MSHNSKEYSAIPLSKRYLDYNMKITISYYCKPFFVNLGELALLPEEVPTNKQKENQTQRKK